MSSLDKSPDRIATMFDAIADRYDVLNTVLSAGIDRYWRRRAIRSLRLTGRETLVDVCTGTAGVALAGARGAQGAKTVLGIDFAAEMLRHGLDKIRHADLADRVRLARGDAMRLPVKDSCADAVTIAFGIRNIQDPAVAGRELLRVLRPGGRLAILEFGLPVPRAARPLYLWYFRHILPRIGRAVSRHAAAYTYLPESVSAFPWGDAFAQVLRDAGFNDVRSQPLTLGIVYLYTGTKC